MTDVCNHCEGELVNEEVKCTGCNNSYHFDCSISETTYRAKSKRDKTLWRCIKCRDKKKGVDRSNPSSRRGSGSSNPMEKDVTTDINKELEELEGEISPALKHFLNKILMSVQFISVKFDEFNKNMEEIIRENKELKQEVKNLNTTIENKDREMDILTGKIYKLQQYKKRKMAEIHGVEEDVSVSPTEQLSKIADVIGATDIAVKTVQRIKLKKSSMLLVKFADEDQRNGFLRKGKSWWKELSQEDKKTTKRLFFNESLIPEYRMILREVREKTKLLGFQFVWVKNGNILVRKEQNSRVISVNTEKDINKIG